MTMHIGDTGEFPVVPARAIPRIPRRPWSMNRAISLAVVAVATMIYILTLIGPESDHILQLPDDLDQMFRAVCFLAIQLSLLAWVYDVLSPGIKARFAALRESGRDISHQIDDRLIYVERRTAERFVRTEELVDVQFASITTGLVRLEEMFTNLGEVVADYGSRKRQEGYEAAMRDHGLAACLHVDEPDDTDDPDATVAIPRPLLRRVPQIQ